MSNFENGWDTALASEIAKPYFKQLCAYVVNEYDNQTVYPPKTEILRALRMVDFDGVKAVILGQDPYHGAGQANGLAFAVNKGIPFPPSLLNICKEIQSEYGKPCSADGSLLSWANQGVLLLNSSLTVLNGQPQSHSRIGWQEFTTACVKLLSERAKPMVFILWGNSAISKAGSIAPHHKVLSSPHPSPLSASRGFFGCNHFKLANEFLVSQGQSPIDWVF